MPAPRHTYWQRGCQSATFLLRRISWSLRALKARKNATLPRISDFQPGVHLETPEHAALTPCVTVYPDPNQFNLGHCAVSVRRLQPSSGLRDVSAYSQQILMPPDILRIEEKSRPDSTGTDGVRRPWWL